MKTKPATKAARSVEAKVELTVHATQKRVWEALVNEATHWWPKSFYSSEKTKRFTIEPRLGGRVFEDFGRGEGFIWYTVNGVESPSSDQQHTLSLETSRYAARMRSSHPHSDTGDWGRRRRLRSRECGPAAPAVCERPTEPLSDSPPAVDELQTTDDVVSCV